MLFFLLLNSLYLFFYFYKNIFLFSSPLSSFLSFGGIKLMYYLPSEFILFATNKFASCLLLLTLPPLMYVHQVHFIVCLSVCVFYHHLVLALVLVFMFCVCIRYFVFIRHTSLILCLRLVFYV